MGGTTRIADRYRLEEQLGAGGMGTVYRAFDERLKRPVALKLLPPERVGDAAAVTRMIREAQATAVLEHDHIVPVYDVGPAQEGGAYLVMQLVEGRTLRERIRQGPLPEAEVVRIVREVGSALAHAHREGIVHRDIKPDNVMLRTSDGRAMVLDFGLARFVEPDEELEHLTADGSFVGTPAYLAPEQARGQEVDGRADQFALGVMAWELCTGRLPWSGDTMPAILASVIADDPEPLAEVASVSPATAAAVTRALSKDAAERFDSMEGLLDSLPSSSSDLGTMPTMAAGTSVPEGDPPESPKKPSRLPLVAALGALAIAGGGVASWGGNEQAAAPVDAAVDADGPLHIGNLPPPQGCNDEAEGAFAEGRRAGRRGDIDSARGAFLRATRADEGCASAHLYLAIASVDYDYAGLLGDAFIVAQRHADQLSPRERGLLNAYGAIYLDDPPRRDLLGQRLEALANERPNDAEILVLAGFNATGAAPEVRKGWAERAIDIDPEFAPAHAVLAQILREQGDIEGAYARYAICHEAAPLSTACMDLELLLRAFQGDCDEMLSLARRMRARSPDQAAPHAWMARSLAVEGAPRAAIERELDGLAAAMPGPEAAVLGPYLRARAAALFGDFEGAVQLANEALDASEDEVSDTDATFVMVEARRELGEEEASALAEAFVTRSVGALTSVHAHPLRAYREQRILVAARETMDAEEFAEVRGSWSESLARRDLLTPMDAWAHGEAVWASTPEEARAALANAPGELLERGEFTTVAIIGHTLLLAGEAARSLPALEFAANSCLRFPIPFLTGRSRVAYGEALAATGDQAGACREWRRVVGAWDPTHSVTGARAATLAAECPAE